MMELDDGDAAVHLPADRGLHQLGGGGAVALEVTDISVTRPRVHDVAVFAGYVRSGGGARALASSSGTTTPTQFLAFF